MSTFKLPDLGEGLAEAEIIEWHVGVGDQVRVDQPMLAVETAKAVVEVPAPFSGTVMRLHSAAGDVVATGAPLIDLDTGTVVGNMSTSREAGCVEPDGTGHAAHPRQAGGEDGGNGERVRAVPAARALARRLGVDLAAVAGSGRDGVVSVDDVLAAAHFPAPVAQGTSARDTSAQALRGMRRAMAHSMCRSRDEVAGSTVCDDADINAWNRRGDYTPRLLRALVAAWRVEPALNAWYDPGSVARTLKEHVDLAIAVDTPDGLIVPVIRAIDSKSAGELRAAVRELKDAAHARQATAADLRDATLTLSNFGTLAGRYGIPLVVPPAVAILGAGRVRDDAVVFEGTVQARRRMPLSLSFDHRCITGGEACRFLAAVIADLEKPD